jgi:hypothetical protein
MHLASTRAPLRALIEHPRIKSAAVVGKDRILSEQVKNLSYDNRLKHQ